MSIHGFRLLITRWCAESGVMILVAEQAKKATKPETVGNLKLIFRE